MIPVCGNGRVELSIARESSSGEEGEDTRCLDVKIATLVEWVGSHKMKLTHPSETHDVTQILSGPCASQKGQLYCLVGPQD
jgi:hypothetical protein